MRPFTEQAFSEYLRSVSRPGAATAMCEDYRASAGTDLEHDRADRNAGVLLRCPLLVLWGTDGVVGRCFDPLAEWSKVAAEVRGEAIACGHYIAEEAPEALLEAVTGFLG